MYQVPQSLGCHSQKTILRCEIVHVLQMLGSFLPRWGGRGVASNARLKNEQSPAFNTKTPSYEARG